MTEISKEFSEIYDKYIEKIYRFIFLKVNSQEIAEDLTSEVFLKAWNVYSSDKYDIKNIQAFLYQVARNIVIDYYRKKGQVDFVPLENLQIPDLDSNPEKKAGINSDLDAVKNALNSLNDDYKEVIILYYLEEIPVREIAQIMNKSESAVRVTIHRALQALKEKLGADKL